jgi:hypothetical protein
MKDTITGLPMSTSKIFVVVLSVLAVVIVGGAVAYSQILDGPVQLSDDSLSPEVQDCFNKLANQKWIESGVTSQVPYFVQVSWNPYEVRTTGQANFEIMMMESETMEPLSDVIYDFVYKGESDLGHVQHRYVEDFSVIDADIINAKINNPCDISVVVFIDQVGDNSYEPDVEGEVTISPVLIQLNYHYLRG